MAFPAETEPIVTDPTTELVWTRLHDDLERFIRHRIRHEADAADVLQETFLRIHNGMEHLRDDERVVAWVYQIARHAITDHYRRARRTEGDLDTTEPVRAPTEIDNLNHAVGAWLMTMIEALPAEYRDALRLVESNGMTQREVAAELGLSVSGAKSRVQRGRALLKQMLQDCCHLDLDRYGNVVDYARHASCRQCCEREDAADHSGCNGESRPC